MAVVGSAEVVVRAITDQVKRDIQKAFADARPVIRREGQKAGDDFAKSFNDSFKNNLDIAGAARPGLNQLTDDLHNVLPDAVRRAGDEIGDEAERALGGAGRRGGNAFTAGLTPAFANAAVAASRSFTSIFALGNIASVAIAGLVSSISAVVSGLFAMASAASVAAGALVVLPGLLAALGTAFGAVKLASGGISAALKANTAATTATTAATGASTAAAAVNEKALKRQAKAQSELTKAKNEFLDSQKELNAASKLADALAKKEEQAQKRVADARKRVQDLMKDPGATKQQIAAGRKELAFARSNLEKIADKRTEAMQAEFAAQQKFNADKKKLDSAAAAAAKADAAVGNTGIASTAAATALDKFNQAMAALTPEARAFVLALIDIKAEFKAVGDEVASRLFPGLTKALGVLKDSSFFDILKKNLGDTGEIVGNIGLQIAEAFTTSRNQTLFQKWLEGSNDILDTLLTTTADGTTPIQSLVNLFLKLAVAIQPVTKRFAEWIGTLLTSADAASSVAGLTKFFDKAGDRAALLGRIVKNLFGVFVGLGKAADDSGVGLLKSLNQYFRDLNKFVNSDEGREKLETYFDGVADNLRALGDLARAIGRNFAALGDNPGIAKFVESIIPAVDAMGRIGDNITSAAPSLGLFLTNLTEIFEVLADTGGIETFFSILNLGLAPLVAFAKSDFGGEFLVLVGTIAAVTRAIGFMGIVAGIAFKILIGGPISFVRNLEVAETRLKTFNATLSTTAGRTSLLKGGLKTLAGVGGLMLLTDGLTGAAEEGTNLGDTLKGAIGGAAIGTAIMPGLGTLIGGVAGGGLAALAGAFHETEAEAEAARLEMVKMVGFESAKAGADSLRDALRGVINTYSQIPRAAVEASFTGEDGKLSEDVKALLDVGVSMDTIVSAAMGITSAQEIVDDAFANMGDSAQRAADQAFDAWQQIKTQGTPVISSSGIPTGQFIPADPQAIKDAEEEYLRLQNALTGASDAQDVFNERVDKNTDSIEDAKETVASLTDQLNITKDIYKKWPQEVRTRVETFGLTQTTEDSLRLIRQYKELQTFDNIKAIIGADGVNATFEQIKKLKKQYDLVPNEVRTLLLVEDVGKGKGVLKDWVKGIKIAIREGASISDDERKTIITKLEAIKEARPDLSDYIDGVRKQVNKAKEKASASTQVGDKLKKGLLSGLYGTGDALAKIMSEAVTQGIEAALKAAEDTVNRSSTISIPFLGVELPGRARGGRVRSGMPYVVGELQPELFIPDQSGTIIPSLKGLGGVDSVNKLLDTLGRASDNVSSTSSRVSSTTNGGNRNVTINVNNPVPERAGQSTSKALRNKALANGWGI